MVETKTLPNTDDGLRRAAETLRDGGLVAFPTETVYGLGADATNDRAVARIYEAKGRPSFNPLIVHCADLEDVKALVKWNHLAQAAAEAFWPGPLTMVLPLRVDTMISRLVTAGLDTLAVRIPAGDTAQRLLRAFGGPVAAPSANTSGQISPTRAGHVVDDLSGRIEAVVDGGPCTVGVESTILGLAGTPTLLRPGGITLEQLNETLGTRVSERRATDKISAPGQIRSHYAPRARVRLNAAEFEDGEARLGFGDIDCDLNLSKAEDLVEAAANLFEFLHRLDATGAPVIAISPIPHIGLGVAINDRLSRAAADR
ncbi:translation factor SUA5 [Tropicibacter naphthalenivorans]|uniref:Threonylcarbamoyl-AMP synthase n=1 Tax=Tropicibacter naphthalenivorans TaxID=441103 RepID=A0A0P1G051_9RHOB|nr:L-threonylcarbamoyladenylate synthase [Tropicibacter naphthalenivorans]CUH75080.1 t(6)A37 threonylcarbamoyladenosine biosynthesis protein RimN [Tropicibacter naphthalenivorans]SMC46853.1 translation factor SUA5 [Tropicibacter naphthalenivorans]